MRAVVDSRRRCRPARSWSGGRAAAIAFVVGLGACGSDPSSPTEVARAFASASAASDAKRMLPLIDRAAVERLEAAAEQASDHVGGRRNIEAWEMLQVAEVDRMGSIVRAELVDEDGRVAHVRLVRGDGGDHVIELVNEEGGWRVRLNPPEPAASPPTGG